MVPTPKNYEILFDVDLDNFTFTSKEKITFKVEKEVKNIELDSKDLNIKEITLSGGENIVLDFKSIKDKLFVEFEHTLSIKKDYDLNIKYDAEIKESLAGFYRSKYEDQGEVKYIATSHFEASDARRAFVCVDHPDYKATFDISFLIDKNLYAISNTLPINEDVRDGKKLIKFRRSPLMSTYLLYLGVGEFEFYQEKYENVIVRGVATKGKSEFTKFGVETAKNVLKYFEDYFDFKYPLVKLDLIAVPDFAAGAMENWGAITFRETALLYYPEMTSGPKKFYIAEVVAHELAHQWFGNLVTMKWWSDLWLNESFATFMAFKAVNNFWPEWKVWEEYLTDTVFRGMKLDSQKSTHPIQVNVDNVDEIDELFDEIAYDKGGSILRMLENFLGENDFRNGLREYIKNYQYKNAQGRNLWETLQNTSKKDVKELMQSFIEQSGFPLLNIKSDKNKLIINQNRFCLGKLNNNNQKWVIPLVIDKEKDSKRILLKNESEVIEIDLNNIINLNKDYSGFYISNYDHEFLKNIIQNWNNQGTLNKMGIINDLYYLSLSNEIKVHDFYKFVNNFINDEKDINVLGLINDIFTKIQLLINNSELEAILIKSSKSILDITDLEPKNNELPSVSSARNSAIYSLTMLNDEKVINFVKEKFNNYLRNEKSLHSNLRAIIYLCAVRIENKNYDIALKKYDEIKILEEKLKFLSALGINGVKSNIEKTLELVFSPNVRFANLQFIFSSLSRNPQAKDMTINWIIENWDKLIENGGGMAHNILRFILKYTIPIHGIDNEKKVKKFFGDKSNENLKKTFEQIWEELEINSNFVNFNK